MRIPSSTPYEQHLTWPTCVHPSRRITPIDVSGLPLRCRERPTPSSYPQVPQGVGGIAFSHVAD